MAATQHGRADGHEVRDRVIAIADELCVVQHFPGAAAGLDVLLGDCLR